MFRNEYRIVSDAYLGYEVQIRRWYFPFWRQVEYCNTFPTVEAAEKFAHKHAFVKHLGRLPKLQTKIVLDKWELTK